MTAVVVSCVGEADVAAIAAPGAVVKAADSFAMGVASVGVVGNDVGIGGTGIGAGAGVTNVVVGGDVGAIVSMLPRYHFPSGANKRAVPLGTLKSPISSVDEDADAGMSPLGAILHALSAQTSSKKIFFTVI